MNTQRFTLAVILALQTGCIAAVAQNVIPKWSAYFLLAGTVLQAFLASVGTPNAYAKEDNTK